MRLRYTRLALNDLADILDHVKRNLLKGHCESMLVSNHPSVGIQTEDPAIRRINTSPYPYLIFYEINGEDIIIHAVRHSARDPSGMPGAR
jgi:plasmid stabilization system protein ParE